MLASPTALIRSWRARAQRRPETVNESDDRELNATRAHNPVNNPGGDGAWTDTRPKRLSRRLSITPEDVFGREALYISARKCWRGVGRKYSSQVYSLNAVERTIELAGELKSGMYKPGKTRTVEITYPKARTALSIPFRDRVPQRSINDIALYPQMTRPFIYANLACQKGKGTTAARALFKAMLRRAYINYGTNRFQILSLDIEKYYDNMRHDVTDALVRKHCDRWTADVVCRTLAHQYAGDVGYNPGSQMVQIAGIAYLDPFDHYAKETLRRKHYIRYMDDVQIFGAPDEDMETVRSAAGRELAKVGLSLHSEKTRTVRADKGVVFLGFLFRVSATGRVLMTRDPKRVKEVRRRLRRLANRIRRGEIPAGELDESYNCVRACMAEGNSARLLRRMDDLVKHLKEELNEITTLTA